MSETVQSIKEQLENKTYGDDTAAIVNDDCWRVILEDVWNGWSDLEAAIATGSDSIQTVGKIEYLDTGETISYWSAEVYLAAYQEALDTMGPTAVRVETLTDDLDVKYRIYALQVGEFGHDPVSMETYMERLAAGVEIGYRDPEAEWREEQKELFQSLQPFLGDKTDLPDENLNISDMRAYGYRGLESAPMLPLSQNMAEHLWREDAPIYLLRRDNTSLPVTNGQELHDWCSGGGMAGILTTDWAEHYPPSDFYELEGGAELCLNQTPTGYDYSITKLVRYPLIGERVKTLHHGSIRDDLFSTRTAVEAITARHGMARKDHTSEHEGSINDMSVTRSGKLQFSEEQYKTARYGSSALEYARAHSYDLVRQGNHFHLRDHDSMVFTTDGRWYWNSHGIKGGAIELLIHYEGMSLPQAVLTLCGEDAREQARPNDTPRTWPPSTPTPQPQAEGAIATAVDPNDPTTEVWTAPPGKLEEVDLDAAYLRITENVEDGKGVQTIRIQVGDHTIGLHGFQWMADLPGNPEQFLPACCIALDGQVQFSGQSGSDPFQNKYDAMRHVLTQTARPSPSQPPYRSNDQPTEKIPFAAPPRGKDFKRLFAYLVSARGLDYDIVSQMVREKRIYATDYRPKGSDMVLHNVAFAGLDEQGGMRSAFLRGSSTMSSFKMETPGSDKTVPFVVPGQDEANKLYVFEAAIDAISHASVEKLSGQDWQQAHRLSQGGNAPIETITRFLEAHPRVTEVVLCMDSDEAGQRLAQRTQEKLEQAGYGHLQTRVINVPLGKDWNEYLQAWRAVVDRYEDHPTTQGEMDGQQTCVGRIHTLDGSRTVIQTTAYKDSETFRRAADGVRRQERIVVETPEQVQQVHRNRARREEAQAKARTAAAEEVELGG